MLERDGPRSWRKWPIQRVIMACSSQGRCWIIDDTCPIQVLQHVGGGTGQLLDRTRVQCEQPEIIIRFISLRIIVHSNANDF